MRSYLHPPLSACSLERIFHALSDPQRLAVVRQLAGVEQASCGELNAGRPKSSMSHHHRILREAGLMETLVDGATHRNRLRRDELEQRFPGLLNSILAQS